MVKKISIGSKDRFRYCTTRKSSVTCQYSISSSIDLVISSFICLPQFLGVPPSNSQVLYGKSGPIMCRCHLGIPHTPISEFLLSSPMSALTSMDWYTRFMNLSWSKADTATLYSSSAGSLFHFCGLDITNCPIDGPFPPAFLDGFVPCTCGVDDWLVDSSDGIMSVVTLLTNHTFVFVIVFVYWPASCGY